MLLNSIEHTWNEMHEEHIYEVSSFQRLCYHYTCTYVFDIWCYTLLKASLENIKYFAIGKLSTQSFSLSLEHPLHQNVLLSMDALITWMNINTLDWWLWTQSIRLEGAWILQYFLCFVHSKRTTYLDTFQRTSTNKIGQ